jgi:hypothetical protein
MILTTGMGMMFGKGRRPIEFVSSVTNSINATTITVNAPSGIVSGDLLVAVLAITDGTVTSAPAGWTVHINANTNVGRALYTKTATGSEPANYSWISSKAGISATILCYTNATGIDVLGARTDVDGTTSTAASITPTKDGVLIGAFALDRSSSTVVTPPSGMTERGLSLTNVCLGVYDVAPSPASTATGDKTLVWGHARPNTGWLFQIY